MLSHKRAHKTRGFLRKVSFIFLRFNENFSSLIWLGENVKYDISLKSVSKEPNDTATFKITNCIYSTKFM